MKIYFIIPILLFFSMGCSSHEKVSHLSSDVCTVMQAHTSQPEVEKLLGPPTQKKIDEADSHEIWFYYKVDRSFLKKLPLIGRRFGHEEYELVTIDFTATTVRKCTYRTLTRDEIIALGVILGEE